MLKSSFLDSGASLSLGPFLKLGASLQKPRSSLVRQPKVSALKSYSCEQLARTPLQSHSCKIDAGTPLESHSLQKNRGVPPQGAFRVPFASSRSKSITISTYRRSAANPSRMRIYGIIALELPLESALTNKPKEGCPRASMGLPRAARLTMRLARALVPSLCAIATAAILLTPISASAQVSAAISGRVEDASGAGWAARR